MTNRNKKCLICNTFNPNFQSEPPSTSISFSRQLLSVFLLRNVFELPTWTLQKYLVNTSGAHPSQWFSVCHQCDRQVRQIKELHHAVLKAKRDFLEAKHKLVEKVRDSTSKSKAQFSNCPTFTDECRQFVEMYDYGQLDSYNNPEAELMNPQCDSDTIADDEVNPSVKTEMLNEIPDEPEIDDFIDATDFSWEEKVDQYLTPDIDEERDDDDDDEYDDYEPDQDPPDSPPPKRRKYPTTVVKQERESCEKKEIDFDDAKDHVKFMATSRGNKMVRYDGHNFYYHHHHYGKKKSGESEGHMNIAYFYCVRSRNDGCGSRVGLRNYSSDDSTYTSFIPSVYEHNHGGDDDEQSTTGRKSCKMYEISAMGKEIVKSNVEMPIPQVFQLIQEKFSGDPEALEELIKPNVQNNVKKMIGNMKRKLGGEVASPPRRERKLGEVVEMAFADVGTSLQFLLTSHGNRMVRYEGHNYYYNGGKYRDGKVVYFHCMKRRTTGCVARVGLRDYNDGDCSYSSVIISSTEPHSHNSTSKTSVMYEITALTKAIIKDNVDMPTTRIFQMVQDSFMNDPEAVEELGKVNVRNNLRKLIGNTKRKFGWKPETPPIPRGKRKSDIAAVEVPFAEVGTSLQFLLTSHGNRMVSYEGHNFYYQNGKYRDGDVTYFNCMMRRRQGCRARVGLKNYKDEDCSFTSFIPSTRPHTHTQESIKRPIMYEVHTLARQIVKDNVDMSITRVFQMLQDSFSSDPEATQELAKVNVQNSVKKVIGNMRRKSGWKPKVGVPQRKGVVRSRKKK